MRGRIERGDSLSHSDLRPQSLLEVGPQRLEGKVLVASFWNRFLAIIILAGVAIVALVVALVIASLMALIIWGTCNNHPWRDLENFVPTEGSTDYAKLRTGKRG
ncbi:MAG: hypothetical protein JO076_10420 [Verrucomicrobia bacterium]|nr:hypothetical protein [Verrucomicrobiota bacterium]